MMKIRLASLVVAIFLIGMMPVTRQQDNLERVRFFLTFVPNVQFAPVYMAIEKGYFEEEGLDVVLEHGDENIGVDLIAAGEIPFGIISGEQVLMARAGGRPVVFVYEWFQTYPVGIVVADTVDGDSVDDLRGLKVGIPGRFGASYSGLIALLAANDMQESDIQLEPIGYVAPDVMCAGRIDASVIYINNEPLQIQQRADEGQCNAVTSVHVLRVADVANMVSNGIVTNEAAINNNPDQVRAFLNAFHRGLQEAINNPAQTYLTSLAFVENLPISDELRDALESAATAQDTFLAGNPSREEIATSHEALMLELEDQFDNEHLTQFRVLLATIELWDGEVLGYNSDESWEITLDTLELMDVLPGPVSLENAYTNALLPEISAATEE